MRSYLERIEGEAEPGGELVAEDIPVLRIVTGRAATAFR